MTYLFDYTDEDGDRLTVREDGVVEITERGALPRAIARPYRLRAGGEGDVTCVYSKDAPEYQFWMGHTKRTNLQNILVSFDMPVAREAADSEEESDREEESVFRPGDIVYLRSDLEESYDKRVPMTVALAADDNDQGYVRVVWRLADGNINDVALPPCCFCKYT